MSRNDDKQLQATLSRLNHELAKYLGMLFVLIILFLMSLPLRGLTNPQVNQMTRLVDAAFIVGLVLVGFGVMIIALMRLVIRFRR